MKNSFLLLLFIPFISFGQGSYNGNSEDASKLCNVFQGNSFSTYENADLALDKVLSVTGMSKRFVLKQCDGIENCLATTVSGIRYILYDKDFMDEISSRSNSWSSVSILAHEIGHHVNGHSLDWAVYATNTESPVTLEENRQMELEADEYSGFVMFKMGATLIQAQEAVSLLTSNSDDRYSTHPSRDKRLKAIERGFIKAGGNTGTAENNSYGSPELTSEDYFYKAYNSADVQYQIENYTKCIKLDPDNSLDYAVVAYNNRGNAKKDLKDYYGAIADYSKAIEINPDDAIAYYNRGNAKEDLKDYYGAIADYNKALEINPDDESAYTNRGNVKNNLEDYYGAIADYSKAIEINPDDESAYYNRGNAKSALKDYYGAIADYSKAIEINPDHESAYTNRGIAKSALKDYYGAIADYSKAIEINPDDATAYNNRGNAKKNLKDYYGAIADYNKALEINPDYTTAYKNRGIVKELLGDMSGACSDWKRACGLGDENCCGWYSDQCK